MKHSISNLYQRISGISLEKEKIKSNIININCDLNFKKKFLSTSLNVSKIQKILSCLKQFKN